MVSQSQDLTLGTLSHSQVLILYALSEVRDQGMMDAYSTFRLDTHKHSIPQIYQHSTDLPSFKDPTDLPTRSNHQESSL